MEVAGISSALLSTLDKLSGSPRISAASTSGQASPDICGLSVSEPEWPLDEEPLPQYDLRTVKSQSWIQASPAWVFSPAPGLSPSPELSYVGRSPAPGLKTPAAAWPSTPEFTPLTGPAPAPFDLGHSAIMASPEMWPSTPDMGSSSGALDLGPMCLPPVQELPAAAESDNETEQAISEPAESLSQAPVSLMTAEQFAAHQAAALAYLAAAYQPFLLAPAAVLPLAAQAVQPASSHRKETDKKSLILAKPSRDFLEPPIGVARTTLLLRNMPNNQTRKMLMEILDREGFLSQYDFLYLPMDFQSRMSMGYSFVNFTSEEVAAHAKAVFEGYTRWRIPSRKVGGASWSYPHQGFEAHVERYRNSPVMHEDVPDNYKPIILQNGSRVPFPAATEKLKAPRQRNSKIKKHA